MDNKNEFIEQPTVPQTDNNFNSVVCDLKTVKILKRLLSGRISEQTLFNTYLFQFLLNENNLELKNAILSLYEQKQKNINLLADAIISFGGVPRFTNGQGNFWSARYVNYITNSRYYISNNIDKERLLIREYQRAKSKTTNQTLINLYNQLINNSNFAISLLNKFI